ncbi:winged helix-turn-helix transcriptional regulator [Lentzea flaviverrucosa]|uniref:Transcriptional regulator, HxlR family n=1 Tax=Lentzea flaviverrucosa TaxID=200379 RepID=A0A1H9M249_9PSEU|nr:helix-turn-helix domain-containing protein [Lentzea flaviverrucosa]RDI31108.1 HxlR family transcriptional regulator [Lentzea flaviverrucosa]SER17565.1 transcriptional regulator, HxlR family [Lentzea flaviverrucosa]
MQVAVCPERAIMEHVTSRWGVLALQALSNGEAWRFSELRRELEHASEKMLTQTLRTLERDGFVHREVFPVIPPHVEYTLTPLGKGAANHLVALAHWIEANVPEVTQAQQRYDNP